MRSKRKTYLSFKRVLGLVDIINMGSGTSKVNYRSPSTLKHSKWMAVDRTMLVRLRSLEPSQVWRAEWIWQKRIGGTQVIQQKISDIPWRFSCSGIQQNVNLKGDGIYERAHIKGRTNLNLGTTTHRAYWRRLNLVKSSQDWRYAPTCYWRVGNGFLKTQILEKSPKLPKYLLMTVRFINRSGIYRTLIRGSESVAKVENFTCYNFCPKSSRHKFSWSTGYPFWISVFRKTSTTIEYIANMLQKFLRV